MMRKLMRFALLFLFSVTTCESVKAQGAMSPAPTNGSKITITTKMEKGDLIRFYFGADEKNRNCWVDINGDGKCNQGEMISNYGDVSDDIMQSAPNNKTRKRFIKKQEGGENGSELEADEFAVVNKTITIYGELSYFAAHGMQIEDINLKDAPNLKKLSMKANLLNELNLSNNKELVYLSAEDNRFNSIDLSNNTKLTFLELSYNELNELKGLDKLVNLKMISLNFTGIKSVDLKQFKELRELYLTGNGMSEVDLSENKKLEILSVSTNALKNIDVKNNKELRQLMFDNNQIETVDLTGLNKIALIYCEGNKLKNLDLKSCPHLYSLSCNNNELTTIDFTNNEILSELYCYKNNIYGEGMEKLLSHLPDLTLINDNEEEHDYNYRCFFVVNTENPGPDNKMTKKQVRQAMAKGWQVLDYSEDEMKPYAGEGEELPSAIRIHTKSKTIDLGVNYEGEIEVEGINGSIVKGKKQTYEVTTGDIILKGDITELDCADNAGIEGEGLTELDVSMCPKLKKLNAWGNKIKSLDLTCNDDIEDVDVTLNELESLKLNRNSKLKYLHCTFNRIKQLSVEGCEALEELECENNGKHLTKLNVNGCFNLNYLMCASNNITELDVSSCTKLLELKCRQNKLTKIDVAGCANLEILTCNENELTEINMIGCSLLQKLDCSSNKLKTLDLDEKNLTELYCEKNKLEKLDLTANTNLKKAYCNWNEIKQLDVKGCASLEKFGFAYNKLESIDLQGCNNLKTVSCYRNFIDGDDMNSLIEALPKKSDGESRGNLVAVCFPEEEDHNICTKQNVKDANDKNWDIYMQNGDDRTLYEGAITSVENLNIGVINIYPNPTSDYLHIENAAQGETVKLFSANGSLAAQQKVASSGSVTIDMTKLPKGSYVLVTGNITKHVVKK